MNKKTKNKKKLLTLSTNRANISTDIKTKETNQ